MAAEIVDKIERLVSVLDRDIDHISETLRQLNELRSMIVRRDEAGLSRLLQCIRAEADTYSGNESERQSIRKELAGALDCDPGQVTLSSLEGQVPEAQRQRLNERKRRLTALIGQLRKEHLNTVLLLSECAKFNRVLLNQIFALGKAETIYYDADGAARRTTEMNLVNLKL